MDHALRIFKSYINVDCDYSKAETDTHLPGFGLGPSKAAPCN